MPAVEESIAEKLAAWRRRRKIRDLYDLFWFGQGNLDEALVRRLFGLKVWQDVVRDGLGWAPLDPAEVVAEMDPAKMPHEDIGLLTQPVDVPKWLEYVRGRYAFVVNFDDNEKRLDRCNPGNDYWVQQLIASLVAAR